MEDMVDMEVLFFHSTLSLQRQRSNWECHWNQSEEQFEEMQELPNTASSTPNGFTQNLSVYGNR